MKLSKINSKRILTTHAGSLPRSKSLVELYSGKTSGEEIDTLKLSSEITAATLSAVNKQAEVGIDIPSNGEQSREAFFLYVQNRMTGFGKTWSRPTGIGSTTKDDGINGWSLLNRGFSWTGAYTTTTAYEIGDIAEYQSSAYISVASTNVNVEPGTSVNCWQAFAIGDSFEI